MPVSTKECNVLLGVMVSASSHYQIQIYLLVLTKFETYSSIYHGVANTSAWSRDHTYMCYRIVHDNTKHMNLWWRRPQLFID